MQNNLEIIPDIVLYSQCFNPRRYFLKVRSTRIPEEARQLLKIYLSGGTLDASINPLVLIEMAKQSGDYAEILAHAKVIRELRKELLAKMQDQAPSNSHLANLCQAELKREDNAKRKAYLQWLLSTLS